MGRPRKFRVMLVGVLLFVVTITFVRGVGIYPSGHLASVIKINESYFDFSQYNLHAAALVELAPEVNVELGVDYQPGETLSPIAWVDYSFLKSVRLQVGRFPIPFGVFNELSNPNNNTLITTPDICWEAIPTPWVDWGARIQWTQKIAKLEAVSLSAYLCNGLGYGQDLRDSRQMTDNNTSNSYGARIAFISPRFGEFGASGYFGARDDESIRNLGLVGLDVHSSVSIVELRGEYVAGLLEFRDNAIDAIFYGFEEMVDNPGEYTSWTNGFYLQLALHISQYAIPALRFDYLGYEDLDLGKNINRQRLGLGVACYPIEPLVIKFETGFTNDNHENTLRLAPLHLQLGVGI
ncbi:hypothetical protein JXM67_07680 [candidate division WOR-3 bacterium]|nr:hypothetical protein [candidate division WOR-3 bacterium]